MDVNAIMTLSRDEIPIENFTANCADNSGRQCLDVKVCFSYRGKNVSGQHEIEYTFELDAETLRAFKRVYLVENGKKIHEKTARFNLTDKNVTTCLNFPQIYVENPRWLIDTLSRLTTDIVFNLKYELVSPPNCSLDTLCPVLNQNKVRSVSEKATILLNCSNNTCHHNLRVDITLDKSEIVLGKTKGLIATIELSNQGEVSYNPEVWIDHDTSLQYEKLIIDKTFKIDKESVPFENATTSEKFRIRGPLDRNKKVTFHLQYSTQNVLGNRRKLYINVKASLYTTTGQEKDDSDNNATASVSVRRDVVMEITGTSNPTLLNYPATAPFLNIQNNNFSAVNVSNVGPNVTVTFELTNKGESDLQSIQLLITYPFKIHDPKEHDYIVYPISIQEKGSGLCNKNTVLNPADLTLENKNSRRRRASKQLTQRTTSGQSFTCDVDELKAKDRFSVVFEFRLWTATLVRYYAKDLLVKIEAKAQYIDTLSTDKYEQKKTQFGSVDIIITPEKTGKTTIQPDSTEKSGKTTIQTSVWVIVVAVLGEVFLRSLFT